MFTDVFILNKYYCIVNCYQLREKIRNLNTTYYLTRFIIEILK